MEFILIVKSKGEEPSLAEMQELINDYAPWMHHYSESGNYLSGSPFHKEGALVNGKGDYKFDGDFLNGPNLITGYIHIEAETLHDAIQIADECPLLAFNSIVVMPILEMK
ncbi:YciI family protein [Flagellimonas sp. 2504JD1-5]